METTSLLGKSYFASIGLLFGIIALLAAIFQDEVALQFDKPEQSRIERSVEKTKEIIFNIDVIDKEQRKKAQLLSMSIGSIGLIFSILAFIRKENLRFSIVVTVVCLAAIFWQYIIILIIALILFSFLNSFLELF